MSDAQFVSTIFFSIVAVSVGWNAYASTVARRRRRMRLSSTGAFFEIGICSERGFTHNVLRLSLDGLRSANGFPVRTSAYTTGKTYDAVLVDSAAPCPAAVEREAIPIYFGMAKPGSGEACPVRGRNRELLRRLNLSDEDVPVPRPVLWLLVAAAVALFATIGIAAYQSMR
jgi:hypothetical protein